MFSAPFTGSAHVLVPGNSWSAGHSTSQLGKRVPRARESRQPIHDWRRWPIVTNNPPSLPSWGIQPNCASQASGSQLSEA